MHTPYKRFFVPVVILCVALLITAVVYATVSNVVQRELVTQFQGQTKEITNLVQSRMDIYTNVAFGAQGLFAASKSVESNEWSAYVATLDLQENYAGISSMSYIERVKKADVAKYPYTIYPASDKAEYFPFTYSVSVVSTTTTLGFDASSEAKRAATLVTAAQTGQPLATPVVLTITTHQPSFSVYAPVYANGADTSTVAERTAALTGFVSVGFRVQRLFDGLTADPVFNKNIDVEIYDANSLGGASASTLLFDTDGSNTAVVNPALGPFSRTSTVTVSGRMWTLYFRTLPGYQLSSIEEDAPWLVLVVGIVLSFLMSWIVYAYAVANEKAESLAKGMTKEIEASRRKAEQHSEVLEKDITERQANEETLRSRTNELERLNALMIGRELKMKELKDELAKLKGNGTNVA